MAAARVGTAIPRKWGIIGRSRRVSDRIPSVDHSLDVTVIDQFSTVGRRQALVDLAQKPLVVVHHALDSL